MVTLNEIKDIAAISSSILSPGIAAAVAIFTVNRHSRERLSGRIVWQWRQDHYGGASERPVLVLHNRSDLPINVVELQYATGVLRRRRHRGTAIAWEDIADLHFPYKIDAGATRQWELNDHEAGSLTDSANAIAQ